MQSQHCRLPTAGAMLLRSLDGTQWHVVDCRLLCQFPPIFARLRHARFVTTFDVKLSRQAGWPQEALQ
jgi:hypothetical protein